MKTGEKIVKEKSIQIAKILQDVPRKNQLDILGSISVNFILSISKESSISWEESFDLFIEHFDTTLRKSITILMKHPNCDFVKVDK